MKGPVVCYPATATDRCYQLSIANGGNVLILIPEEIDTDDFADLEEWAALVLRSAKRTAVPVRPRAVEVKP